MNSAALGLVTLPELAGALIASFEGYKLTAYQDSGGVWTIGRGHTGNVNGVPIHAGMAITPAMVELLFAQDQAPLFTLVAGRPVLEAAAFVSFGYNCGQGALRGVLASERLPDGDTMKTTVLQFNHVHGVVVDGLVRRRALEWALICASRQMGGK